MADKEVKAVDTAAAKDKPAKETAKKPNAFVRGWSSASARNFREMNSELKKVVWPTRQAGYVRQHRRGAFWSSLVVGVHDLACLTGWPRL